MILSKKSFFCFLRLISYKSLEKFLMLMPISLSANTRTNPQKQRSTSFCARLEYEILKDIYGVRTRASSLFRRGSNYGDQCANFKDVINAIKLVLKKTAKPKILIVGVGEAQEPLSILAVIESLKKGKHLRSVVDLNCVDLQPKLSEKTVTNCSYMTNDKPMFARQSFVRLKSRYDGFVYKIKSNIVRYLKGVFNNPTKTKWDTKVEEFVERCPKETYDVISINNVLIYIHSQEKKFDVLKKLTEMLKPGGILITDLNDEVQRQNCDWTKTFKNLSPGIWQKPAK